MNFIQQIKEEIISRPTKGEIQQYVADVFLASASSTITINDTCRPNRASGYHIEFVFDDLDSARGFSEILAAYDILPKLTCRSGSHIIYIKSSDCICNLLALIGANKALMALNNEIAMRELRNNANRRTNCDTYNIERQVAAAKSQVEIVKKLAASGSFDRMDNKLREVAAARLDHPEATYDELAKILGLTKSGVVHRLRRLCSEK